MNQTPEREPMIDYQEYNEILDAIHQLKSLAYLARRNRDFNREAMCCNRIDAICERCNRIFDDRDGNLKNYLNKKPMKMFSGGLEQITITPCSGRDTLFVLLVCCKRANNGEPTDKGTQRYLLKLLKKDGCRIITETNED